MSNNSKQFLQAATVAKNLNSDPNNDELGKLYGLYKQATVGDINIEKPGMFNFKASKNGKLGMQLKENQLMIQKLNTLKIVNSLIKKYGLKK